MSQFPSPGKDDFNIDEEWQEYAEAVFSDNQNTHQEMFEPKPTDEKALVVDRVEYLKTIGDHDRAKRVMSEYKAMKEQQQIDEKKKADEKKALWECRRKLAQLERAQEMRNKLDLEYERRRRLAVAAVQKEKWSVRRNESLRQEEELQRQEEQAKIEQNNVTILQRLDNLESNPTNLGGGNVQPQDSTDILNRIKKLEARPLTFVPSKSVEALIDASTKKVSKRPLSLNEGVSGKKDLVQPQASGDDAKRKKFEEIKMDTLKMLASLSNRVERLENDTLDVQRQLSKRCIIFKGNFYEPKTDKRGHKEELFSILSRMVEDKWDIRMRNIDIATYHPLGNGIIVEFLSRGPGSAFEKILNADTKKNPKIQLTAKLRLCDSDRRYLVEAKRLVQSGSADSCTVNHISGKVMLEKNGSTFSIFNWQDIEAFGENNGT
jgi:hypothetical protein